MTSRIAKPGQTDQRKVYLNWANHQLRKLGGEGAPLSDLKEVGDGLALPRVLKAVVQEPVPGIHSAVATDEDRRDNIEKCIRFLDKFGVNCSSFTTKDLCDGKDRAVLSLFYNLSQYKRATPTNSTPTNSAPTNSAPTNSAPTNSAPTSSKSAPQAGTTPPTSGPAPSKSTPQPSRIARPVSPGLKASHGVNNGSVVAPIAINSLHTSQNSLTASSNHSMSPPATSPISPNPANKLTGPRRTAGSSIMTSTTFSRPFVQRKAPVKSASQDDEETKTLEVGEQNGDLVSSPSGEVKSDPETESPKQPRTTKLAKHSSFSFGSKETRLLKPSASKGTTSAEGAESATPPTQSKLKGPSRMSKLPGPKGKESSSEASSGGGSAGGKEAGGDGAGSGDAEDHTEPHRPPSRLKFPGSGRSTPSNSNRSGIQRPSSRLSKKGSNSINSLEGAGQEEESGGKLRLQRKGSDGLVKRHLVLPASKSGHVIPSGTASLPRHLPKGVIRQAEDTHTDLSSSTEDEVAVDAAKSAHVKDGENKSTSPGKGEGVSGLKRPGLKKPGVSLTGVCTPNLPSSGPQTSTTIEAKDRTEGGGAVNNHTPHSSPSLGKKLIAPKASGASKQTLESRLKRCVSPSPRNKLHKVTPTPGLTRSLDTNEPASGSKPLPSKVERDTELSSSSIGSEASSQAALGQVVRPVGQVVKPVKPAGQVVRPVDKEEIEAKADSSSVDQVTENGKNTEDIVTSGQMEVESEGGAKEGEGHLRFGRRISPEGMSHEEISPKVEGNSQATPPQSPVKDAESATKPEDGVRRSDDHTHQSRQSHYENATSAGGVSSPLVQRARSLSPKSPYRLMPKGMSRVRDLEGGVGGALIRVNSSESTSSEGIPAASVRKPLKSSMRRKGRHSSSSSTEGVVSPVPRQPKVTISPRSSQMVYDPDSGVQTPPSGQFYSPNFLSPGGVASDRPISFASIDSSTSGSLSPSSSSHALYMRGGGVARHASLRSNMSEHGDMAVSPSEGVGSGLIESFENQLTDMKAELTDKDRMLSMYENSMADLNSKMHILKKSIEEKDNAIQHLTEKQTWYDLDGNSLMLGRGSVDHEALSDGYLSDSAMDEGKEKKKKKAWKFPFQKKKKETGGLHMEHLSPNMDTESVISSRTAKSVSKKSFGKKKTPDLMSISEYPPELESRYRDIDTKSTYTMDARSEYGGGVGGLLPLWEEDPIIVYDDPEPGARAEIILFIDTNEGTKAPANDSGYYGELFGRHGISSNKWGRESVGSSDSGNHGDDGTEQFILGTLSISPELSWVSMDSKVADIFHHHISTIDSERSLGLKEDSIYCYFVGDERRQMGNALLPPITPHEALGNKLTIKVYMKGAGQQSCDSLAYKTLMGVESLQSYIGILQETQWLVVMGTKGTCKSSLVSGLAQHLSSSLEAEEGEGMEDLVMGISGGEVIRFNLDKDGLTKILKYFKADLVKRVQLQLHPPIVILEDIYECKDLEQLLVAASALSRRPYIIATLSSGTTKGIPLHQLMFHHQIRLVTCNPQTEPVVGILARSLRKQIYQVKATAQSLDPVAERLVNWVPYLLNHLNDFINKFHSNVVNLGPRVFMACPLNNSTNELETWFLSLWNHFIIPYLMGTIMAGIETYTADPMLEWVDVREWVVETYPWPSAINVNKLRTLNPEDVGWNHAVRPHQNRYIVVKDDKSPDDTRSILRQETRSFIH